jgi:hypothetical protein
MAHKTLINGTAYEIKDGKTLINGVSYTITGGKTLVNGTSFSISFATTDSGTFTFYIEVDGDYGTAGTYEAIWPMTWGEFCDSPYNGAGLYIYRGYPTAGHSTCVYDSNWIEQSETDVISPGETYIIG